MIPNSKIDALHDIDRQTGYPLIYQMNEEDDPYTVQPSQSEIS